MQEVILRRLRLVKHLIGRAIDGDYGEKGLVCIPKNTVLLVSIETDAPRLDFNEAQKDFDKFIGEIEGDGKDV